MSLAMEHWKKRLENAKRQLDDLKNENNDEIISTENSKVSIMRIPTNEELVIALDTEIIVSKIQK
jgi:acetate kinase